MAYAVVCKLSGGIAIGSTVIRGTAVDRSKPRPAYIIYGWALTEGVPDDVWEAWFNANARSPMVQSQMIFGSKDLMEARRFAYQHSGIRAPGFGAGTPQGKVNPN